jgi:hypothetical protein
MDTRPRTMRIILIRFTLDEFDHKVSCVAKVRNVSRLGSQTVRFEKSLPVVQRKAYVITTFWRKLVRVMPSPPATDGQIFRQGER